MEGDGAFKVRQKGGEKPFSYQIFFIFNKFTAVFPSRAKNSLILPIFSLSVMGPKQPLRGTETVIAQSDKPGLKER